MFAKYPKKEFSLLFKKWKPEDTMVNGKFDIMEPSNNKYIEPNILIVPLVAFDPKKSFRLWRGILR